VVMVVTVVIVVWTHDLAQGVLAGVILSGLFFASKVKRIFMVESELSADGLTRRYQVSGQVFFASSDSFVEAFDYKEVLDRVVIDVSQAHFWDISAVGTLDKAILKFRREGTEVEMVGLNEASASMIDRFAIHDKPGAQAQLGGH
jgi:SulP family sulfate permease